MQPILNKYNLKFFICYNLVGVISMILKENLINNKYIIEEKITDGDKSSIYKGRTLNGERITIKFLVNAFDKTDDKEILELFNRESKALSILSHTNIVEYVDSGIFENKFYIITRYFDATNLNIYLKENDINFDKKLYIIRDLLVGIQEAHSKKIIHRDLKPSNILINPDRKIKIIDFGVSKLLDHYSKKTGYTLKYHISIPYASPEQLKGEKITYSSDIYSVGAIFYFLITGQEPIESRSKLFDEIEYLGVSETIKVILRKALAIETEKRYSHTIQFINDINQEILNINSLDTIKLFVPGKFTRMLKNEGKISQQSTELMKRHLEKALSQAYILKTTKNYLLITEDYKIKVVREAGYLKVVNLDAIEDYRSFEYLKSKGLEIHLNLDIVTSLPVVKSNLPLQSLLKNIDEKFNSQKSIKDKIERSSLLLNEWDNTLNIIEKYNLTREKIGSYKNFEYIPELNILKVEMNTDIDEEKLQFNDSIKMTDKNKKFVTVGTLKEVDGDYLRIILKNDIELDNINNAGELRLDINQSKSMISKFKNGIKNLSNNQSVNKQLLDFILSPETLSVKEIKNDIQFFNADLDIANRETVKKCLATNDMFIIQGPPGTGKSTVITELIKQIYHLDSNSKILFTSPSHVAVDHLLSNLSEDLFNKIIVRIGDSDKISTSSEQLKLNKQINKWAEKVKDNVDTNVKNILQKRFKIEETEEKFINAVLINGDEASEIDEKLLNPKLIQTIQLMCKWKNRIDLLDGFNDIFAKDASLIASTCVGIASNHSLKNLTYDWVIIDEAARATAPELILPMLRGKRIILVGDHKQLPPIVNLVDDQVVSKSEIRKLEKSLFEEIFGKISEEAKDTLKSQFRMHSAIAEMIREVFYPTTKIITKIPNEKREHGLSFKEKIIWLDTSHNENNKEKEDGTSFKNNLEMYVIKKELEKINDEYQKIKKESKVKVAVITGYNAQKKLLIDNINPNSNTWTHIEIHIDSIDAFQGSESDIVFYSLVRSNQKSKIGFLRDERRLNVALSRARSCLFIVGNKNFFSNTNYSDENYIKNIIGHMTKNSSVCSFKEVE